MNANRSLVVALVVLAGCSGLALAQNEVFFTGPSNTIQQANFATSTATPLIVQSGSSFKGLAVRDDGLLVVAKATKNSAVAICDPVAKTCQNIFALDSVVAVAVSNHDDLFAVNSTAGGKDLVATARRAFNCGVNPCLPGDYDPAGITVRQITSVAGQVIQQLVDVKLSRSAMGNVEQGSVLVLSQKPPLIFSLPPDLSGDPTVIVGNGQGQFTGLTPNGFELGPTGTILVTTKEKIVAQFDLTNGTRLANFAALPGQGISVTGGLEIAGSALPRVYVTVHDGSRVLRLDQNGTITGQINLGINPPYGITSTTSNSYAPTPAGSGVSVSTSSLSTTWEEVEIPGLTTAVCTDFVDPREDPFVDSNLVVCVKPNLDLVLGLSDFACSPGTKRIIPSFMRGWRKVGPGDDTENAAFPSRDEPAAFPGPTGPFTIRLCQVDYSVAGGFAGVIIDQSFEDTWLGYDPGHVAQSEEGVCVGGPRAFYSTSDGEPPILENPFPADFAISCGINLIGSSGRSFLFPTVRDRRAIDNNDLVADADDVNGSPAPGFCDPAAGALDCKLAVLLTLANVDLTGDHKLSLNQCRAGDGPCCVADNDLRVQLGTRLLEARLAVDQARRFSPSQPACTEDYQAASTALESFIATIQGAGAAAFSGCEPQLDAQFRARAMSADFLLTTLLTETETEVCEVP